MAKQTRANDTLRLLVLSVLLALACFALIGVAMQPTISIEAQASTLDHVAGVGGLVSLVETETPSPTPAPTPPPTPTPVPTDTVVRIRAIGDLMMHDNQLKAGYDSATKSYDFDSFFELVAPVLSSADYTIGNLETSIQKAGSDYFTGYPRFRSPDTYLRAIKLTGMDLLTLANNHSFDNGYDGIATTLAAVERAGFDHTGLYRSQAEHDNIFVKDVKGITIAFLPYTYSANGLESIIPKEALTYSMDFLNKENMLADVRRARKLADVVIVVPHWGEEYTRQPNSTQKSLAEALCEAGADVVLGSHPHMVQPIVRKTVTREDGTQHDAIIAYSMGNFISDQRAQYKDTGMIVSLDIRKDGASGKITFEELGYIPTWVFRSGSGSRYAYRVLPMGQYVNMAKGDLPEVLRGTSLSRMKSAYEEVTKLVGVEPAKLLSE